jgi:hypothetical protein
MSGIDLTSIPTQLGAALGTTAFVGGLIASAFMILMFDMPIIIFGRDQPMMLAIMTVLVLSIDVALTWLPYFTLIIIIFMLALLFASEMRTWITGRGH